MYQKPQRKRNIPIICNDANGEMQQGVPVCKINSHVDSIDADIYQPFILHKNKKIPCLFGLYMQIIPLGAFSM